MILKCLSIKKSVTQNFVILFSEYCRSNALTETKAADAESSPIYFVILIPKVKQVKLSKDRCDDLGFG